MLTQALRDNPILSQIINVGLRESLNRAGYGKAAKAAERKVAA